MKIIDIVKFNDSNAFILDDYPKMTYHEEWVKDDVFGLQKMLIGENEFGMMDFLTYHDHRPFKAFAGREFTIKMNDGSERVLKDVWWDEGATRWQKHTGINLVGFTYQTAQNLKTCYVFYGSSIRKDRLEELLNKFYESHKNYKIWEYNDYEKYIKSE